MAVRVERGSTWNAGDPTKLFDDPYYHRVGSAVGRTYDVSAGGHRFLMVKPAGGPDSSEAAALIVVQNWIEELRKLAPPK